MDQKHSQVINNLKVYIRLVLRRYNINHLFFLFVYLNCILSLIRHCHIPDNSSHFKGIFIKTKYKLTIIRNPSRFNKPRMRFDRDKKIQNYLSSSLTDSKYLNNLVIRRSDQSLPIIRHRQMVD